MRPVISHYQIIERIGVGGTGEVFKAKDLKLGRIVAIKMLSEAPVSANFSKMCRWTPPEAAASLCSVTHQPSRSMHAMGIP